MAVLVDLQANDSSGAAATFNLKAVVQETGLKPDTLRAWERRYGVPKPKRTAGGHRLYSQDDINLLKWLIARQDEGLSISRAVDLWQRLLDESKNPFAELPVEEDEPVPIISHTVPVGATLIQMREGWVEACMVFEEQTAENILNQALSMYSPETVCFELLQRGLTEIGQRWYDGEISVQQEHFASALARRRLEALLVGTPPPTRQGRILISCAPDEEHTFSSLVLTLLMRRRGWEAIYLGANVPIERLEATVATVEPTLIVLTAQTLWTAATLLSMVELLVEKGMNVAFGGLVFSLMPSLVQRIPAHYLGDTLEATPHIIEKLLNSPRQAGSGVAISPLYRDALQQFIGRKAQIEAVVLDLMNDSDIRPNTLNYANSDFSRHIKAALMLGDITLLGTTIDWVEMMLVNQYNRLPTEQLRPYVSAFATAAEQTLNDRGKIIVNWLNTILDNAAD